MNEQPEDTLTAAYRRASEADAGRPAAATRQAILAQAAAMAAVRRRAPAANDARYWPRMVAGIAVLGVGVLLWKQTDHRMPGDAAEVVMAPPTTEAELVRESVTEPVPVPARVAESTRADKQVETSSPAITSPAAASRAVPSPPSPAPPSLPPPQPVLPDPFPNSPPVAEAMAPPPGPKAEAPLPAAPPPSVAAPAAPPLLAANQAEEVEEKLSEAAVTGTRVQAPGGASAAAARGGQAPRGGGAGGARAGGAGAARAGGPGGGGPPPGQALPQGVDRAALLRQYFPAQYQSDAPHSLWLVQDAAGEVELSGELAPGQRLEDLTPQILRTLGDRAPGPWQVATVRNARGQPITLAIARLP
jgi:hypothetical protein